MVNKIYGIVDTAKCRGNSKESGGRRMLGDGTILNGIIKEDLADKVPGDQVRGLWYV